jgi:hypothetical protein
MPKWWREFFFGIAFATSGTVYSDGRHEVNYIYSKPGYKLLPRIKIWKECRGLYIVLHRPEVSKKHFFIFYWTRYCDWLNGKRYPKYSFGYFTTRTYDFWENGRWPPRNTSEKMNHSTGTEPTRLSGNTTNLTDLNTGAGPIAMRQLVQLALSQNSLLNKQFVSTNNNKEAIMADNKNHQIEENEELGLEDLLKYEDGSDETDGEIETLEDEEDEEDGLEIPDSLDRRGTTRYFQEDQTDPTAN